MKTLIFLYFITFSLGNFIIQNHLNFTSSYSSFLALDFGDFLSFEIKCLSSGCSLESQKYNFFGHKIKSPFIFDENPLFIFDISNSRLNKNADPLLKVWAQLNFDGSFTYNGMIFDTKGSNLTSPFPITSTCQGNSQSYYTNLNNGNFVFVWSSHCSGDSQLYTQILDKEGKKIGDQKEIVSSDCSNFSVYNADIASLSNNGFIVVYEANYKTDVVSGFNLFVYGQLFFDNGTKNGSFFEIFRTQKNTVECNGQGISTDIDQIGVIGLENDRFLVIYNFINNLNLEASLWDLNDFVNNKSFLIGSSSIINAEKQRFTYSFLDDNTIIIVGCCVLNEDLWYFRLYDTNIIESSSLKLGMNSFFFLTFLQQSNSILLVFDQNNTNQSTILQKAVLYKFLNESALDIIPSKNQSESDESGNETEKLEDDEDSYDVAIIVAVLCSIFGLIVIFVIIYLVKKCRAGLKDDNTENKVFRPNPSKYEMKSDQYNLDEN